MNVGQGQSIAGLYTGQCKILANNNINAGKRAADNTVAQYNQGGRAAGSIANYLRT
jgi:hypothetical protein